jgi:predicted Rossmann fold flavoprotein
MWAWDVIVIGAGAAGLVAAERAASRGLRTVLLEKNRRPGVKILMSGGTRCNITHHTNARGIAAAFGELGQSRFLHSPLAALGPGDVVALVEAEGVATRVESTGKIFPVSNKAADVLGAFLARLHRSGAELRCRVPVREIERRETGFVVRADAGEFIAPNLVVTTGGQSYPGCGTTGDGYRWLRNLGHTIVPPRPALVPLTVDEPWVRELSGLTLPDVEVTVVEKANSRAASNRKGRSSRPDGSFQKRGSVLFTHFGFSGPVVLDLSRSITTPTGIRPCELRLNILPETSPDELRSEWDRLVRSQGKALASTLAPTVLPQRLREHLLAKAGIDDSVRLAEFGRERRQRLLEVLTALTVPVTGTRGFAKAEVTAGGLALDEVDSRRMESLIVPGLFIAGEVLDLDGPIGGFNFQAAFSTGWVAGNSVRAKEI